MIILYPLRDYNSQMSSARKSGLDEGKRIGIKALLKTCKDFGASKEDTVQRLMDNFQITEEEAWKYMDEYWN